MSAKNGVMTIARKAPTPTPTQAEALADAVFSAYRRGWNGDLEHKEKPRLDRGGMYRVGVHANTKGALITKDFVRAVVVGPGSRTTHFLTRSGVEAGTKAFTDKRGVSPAALAEEEKRVEEKRAKEREKRIKDVRHLFRGLKVERSLGGSKAVSSHIDGSEVRLNLDDLEVLGKGIEKLRAKAKKAA